MIGSVHMLGDLPGIAFITFIGMKMRKWSLEIDHSHNDEIVASAEYTGDWPLQEMSHFISMVTTQAFKDWCSHHICKV